MAKQPDVYSGDAQLHFESAPPIFPVFTSLPNKSSKAASWIVRSRDIMLSGSFELVRHFFLEN